MDGSLGTSGARNPHGRPILLENDPQRSGPRIP